MARIIPLHGSHEATQQLLPWYATGQLDAVDRQIVDAHLAGCVECAADLQLERQLSVAVAALPVDVDTGWTAFQQSFAVATAPSASQRISDALGRIFGGVRWIALPVAAMLCVGIVLALPERPAAYHALGSPPAAAPGNIIVVFRPDTTEARLRQTLLASGARLVGGPTAADAYVLHVPAEQRTAALGILRAQTNVIVAEPLEAPQS